MTPRGRASAPPSHHPERDLRKVSRDRVGTEGDVQAVGRPCSGLRLPAPFRERLRVEAVGHAVGLVQRGTAGRKGRETMMVRGSRADGSRRRQAEADAK
jgi:hypothetical protein